MQPVMFVRVIVFKHNSFLQRNLFCTYERIANILFNILFFFSFSFTICCLVMKKEGEYTKCNLNMQWDKRRYWCDIVTHYSDILLLRTFIFENKAHSKRVKTPCCICILFLNNYKVTTVVIVFASMQMFSTINVT